jgi:hypothetical protein
MKFCFYKRLASAIEEGTTSFELIERPITCVSALYDAKTGKLEGEEYTSRLVSGIT